MTRINVGVHPEELPNKLLIAEHREITRIPNSIRSGKAKLKNIPPTFRLGTGHVTFFYDKLGYLKDRYRLLYDECIKRGWKVTDKHSAFDGLEAYSTQFKHYLPTPEDRQLIVERIESRGFKLEIFEKISPTALQSNFLT